MYIVFDVGNTHMCTSILRNDGFVLETFRKSTDEKTTEDEFYTFFKSMLEVNEIKIDEIKGMMVSSVVPMVTQMLKYFAKKYFDIDIFVVDINKKLPFTFEEGNNPKGMGPDRIIDIVQALKEYPDRNLIIFDFGTATTYEVLKKNVYVGGGIFPGIRTTFNALFGRTARLPKVDYCEIDTVLGKDTVEQIQAAIFNGYIGQVKYLIEKIKEELGEDCFVIATGGLSKIMGEKIKEIDVCSSKLSIRGIYTLYKMNLK
ncbi:MAG: type III pantothenate kinase [Fusobacterium sp. JB019]|nr:type III pantothenate kinase [Fusobacterium sp. JB020]MDP0505667.1 type III pantothenate kinase [Fusobacterium sp. JB019]